MQPYNADYLCLLYEREYYRDGKPYFTLCGTSQEGFKRLNSPDLKSGTKILFYMICNDWRQCRQKAVEYFHANNYTNPVPHQRLVFEGVFNTMIYALWRICSSSMELGIVPFYTEEPDFGSEEEDTSVDYGVDYMDTSSDSE